MNRRISGPLISCAPRRLTDRKRLSWGTAGSDEGTTRRSFLIKKGINAEIYSICLFRMIQYVSGVKAFWIICSLVSSLVLVAAEDLPLQSHPDSSGWKNLFDDTLSNARFPKGVWTVADGVMTASEDQAIWSERPYDNFVLDLESV